MIVISLSLSSFKCDVSQTAIVSPHVIRYASGYADAFLQTRVKENDSEQLRVPSASVDHEATEAVKSAATNNPETEQTSIVPERHKEEPNSNENSSSFSNEEGIPNKSNNEQNQESEEIFSAAQNNTYPVDPASLDSPRHQETAHINSTSLSHDSESQEEVIGVENYSEGIPSHRLTSLGENEEALEFQREESTEQTTTHRGTTEQRMPSGPPETTPSEEINQYHSHLDENPHPESTTLAFESPPVLTNSHPPRYSAQARPSTWPSHDIPRHGMRYEQNLTPTPRGTPRYKDTSRQQPTAKKFHPHRQVHQERERLVTNEHVNNTPRRVSGRKMRPNHSAVEETNEPFTGHKRTQNNRQHSGRRQNYRSSTESSPPAKTEYKVSRRNRHRENLNKNVYSHGQHDESMESEEENIPLRTKNKNLERINARNFQRKSQAKKAEEFTTKLPVNLSPEPERNERLDSPFVTEKSVYHIPNTTKIRYNKGHNGVEETAIENSHITPLPHVSNKNTYQKEMDQNSQLIQKDQRPKVLLSPEDHSSHYTESLVPPPKLNQDGMSRPVFMDTHSSTTERTAYPVEVDYDENLYYKSYAPPPNKSLYAILFDVLGNQAPPGKKENTLLSINNKKESQPLYDVSPKSFINSPNREFEPSFYKTRENQGQLNPDSTTIRLNSSISNDDETPKSDLPLREPENETKRTITDEQSHPEYVSPKPNNLPLRNSFSENEHDQKYIANHEKDVPTQKKLENNFRDEETGYVIYLPPDDNPKKLKTSNLDDERIHPNNQRIKTKDQEEDERELNVQKENVRETALRDYPEKNIVSKSSNHLEESSGELLSDPRTEHQTSQEAPTYRDDFESKEKPNRGNGRRVTRPHSRKRRPENLEVTQPTVPPETDDCSVHQRRRSHNCRGRGTKRANSSSRRHSDDTQRQNSPRGIFRHRHQSHPSDYSENGADTYSHDENIRVKVILPQEEAKWDEWDDPTWGNGGSPEDFFEYLPTWESFRIVPKAQFSEGAEVYVEEEEEPEPIPLRAQPPPTTGWRPRQRPQQRPFTPPNPISSEEDVLPVRKRSGKRARTRSKSDRNAVPEETISPIRKQPDPPRWENGRPREAETLKETGESDPEKHQDNRFKMSPLPNKKASPRGNRHENEMSEPLPNADNGRKSSSDIDKPIKIKEISENVAYDEYYRPYQPHGQRGLYSFDIYQPYTKMNQEGFDNPDRKHFFDPKYKTGVHVDDEGSVRHRNALTEQRLENETDQHNFGKERDVKGHSESKKALLDENNKFICDSGKCDSGEKVLRHGSDEQSDEYSSGSRSLSTAARRPDIDIHGWRPFDDWD